MAHKHKSGTEIIEEKHNTARFFAEHREVALVLLVAVFAWGWYGYRQMPKRKDPSIPVRVAVASCQWPGATAEQVEQLVTRPIEDTVAQNAYIKPPNPSSYGIRSISFPGLSLVFVQLDNSVSDTRKQFSDINLKLNAMNSQLPQGAGPISFNSDFGDTATLMLTVASPRASGVEVVLRARSVRKALEDVRAGEPTDAPQPRVSLVYSFPQSVGTDAVRQSFELAVQIAVQEHVIRDSHVFEGPGFIGVDASSYLNDSALRAWEQRFLQERFHRSEIHPDAWEGALIRDSAQTEAKLAAVAGDKYSYRELDDFTDLIQRTVQGAPQVAKVSRSGVLPEQVYLDYSQARLAEYGLQPANLKNALGARNITLPGGSLEVGPRIVTIDPSGQFQDAQSIGDVIVGASSSNNSPVYLRDLVDISRGYQSPARFLNYFTWRDEQGHRYRSRAITLAIQMKEGEQVEAFGETVDEKLIAVKKYLPADLIMAHTSDQPLQVKENIDLFMEALYEAIVLVILVSLLGFWEWRSALLMAISIPITLAMTFGLMWVLHVDIQQVSIATLIIALGLLVDDPVVAGDSIKRSIADGQPNVVAAWLGPTKLATAILFATITNIVAYVPFLLLTGNTGEFLYSLPIVMACALVTSRIVSMTFVPLLGYYLLRRRRKPEKTLEERRRTGFTGLYARVARFSIDHRWKVFAGSLVFLAFGIWTFTQLKPAFFPEDVQYWSYVDVWLPNDSSLQATNDTAKLAEQVVRSEAEKFGREHPDKSGEPRDVLRNITTFVGGGGPRFWFSVTPQLQQLNYAQVLIELTDRELTPKFVSELQPVLRTKIPGARLDVRQLQTNPVEYPVEIRIASQADVTAGQEEQDIRTLRRLAGQVEDIFTSIPTAAGVRNDWEAESSRINLKIDPDRANLVGITNSDVASSSTAAMSGYQVTTLREGDKQIPVVARLQINERAQLADMQNLYVYSSQGTQKVPLISISNIEHAMDTERIVRLEHFRTISVRCFPTSGRLSSEVLAAARPKLQQFQKSLPPGYKMQIGGEDDKQKSGFKNLALVMAVSVFCIFLALLFQFNSAVKPLLVFGAVPYGVVGSLTALWFMGTPFNFMAFLGIASLVGVIVSHIILLFDFIEEQHQLGEPFEDAVIDAGIIRVRPVLITVGATVLALFPLAVHGGPLWQPLCYAQIGGLLVAFYVTKVIVPVMYAIFVLDLRILRWETNKLPDGATNIGAGRVG